MEAVAQRPQRLVLPVTFTWWVPEKSACTSVARKTEWNQHIPSCELGNDLCVRRRQLTTNFINIEPQSGAKTGPMALPLY